MTGKITCKVCGFCFGNAMIDHHLFFCGLFKPAGLETQTALYPNKPDAAWSLNITNWDRWGHDTNLISVEKYIDQTYTIRFLNYHLPLLGFTEAFYVALGAT